MMTIHANLCRPNCFEAYQKLKVAASRFKINNPPFGVDFKLAEMSNEQPLTVTVILEVRERDTGRSTFVMDSQVFDPLGILSEDLDYLFHRFRQQIQRLVLHEIDECLMVDGVRMWDPHKDEVTK